MQASYEEQKCNTFKTRNIETFSKFNFSTLFCFCQVLFLTETLWMRFYADDRFGGSLGFCDTPTKYALCKVSFIVFCANILICILMESFFILEMKILQFVLGALNYFLPSLDTNLFFYVSSLIKCYDDEKL